LATILALSGYAKRIEFDAAHRIEMATHLDYVEDDVDDPDAKPDESKAAELEAFGRHADVVSAFQKFCVAEMLLVLSHKCCQGVVPLCVELD
jgi:hypothetical protein